MPDLVAILNGTEKRQLYGLLKKLGLFAAEAPVTQQ